MAYYYPNPFVNLIVTLLDIYGWIVLAAVVMSWLVNFGVINIHNQFARSIVRFLDAMTEPLFRQVRRFVPSIGGLDISPLIVLIGVLFLQNLVQWGAVRLGL
jgi:YggT family protein